MAPFAVRIALCLGLLAVVMLLDLLTGAELSFSIFYLIPVSFAAAFLSRRAGWALAVLSAGVWGLLEATTGRGLSAAWILYWNTTVRLGFFVLVTELIVRLLGAHERERALSRTDSLTGIANARVFREDVARAIDQSRRAGRPFTVTYIDLDRFKQVNDSLGHSEGDRVLRAVAELIVSGVRTTDVVARLGGDEFGILMPETESEQAQVTLERIAVRLERDIHRRWAVGATFGAVTFTEPPEDVDCAMRQSDALMYRGKDEGRGRILRSTWPESAVGCD
ncbi:MAG: GGDEF domain-containing protein [Actinobacteria bacterium HGW-Actinobacteria-7]|nr:MAG: GGDEF domain-containing protein [Actinobacteria bacterium HGW-Actinobacteria-7]